MRFLILLFYNFLRNRSSLIHLAFSHFRAGLTSNKNWVHRNKYRILQWDALRRYNAKFTKRMRGSLYKKRLIEYKKLKFFYYTLRDAQFRKFVRLGVPLYTRYKAHFLSFLEFRLLTFSVRLGIYKTHAEGYQHIRHHGLVVNNKRVFSPNYALTPGGFLDFPSFFYSSGFYPNYRFLDGDRADFLQVDALSTLLFKDFIFQHLRGLSGVFSHTLPRPWLRLSRFLYFFFNKNSDLPLSGFSGVSSRSDSVFFLRLRKQTRLRQLSRLFVFKPQLRPTRLSASAKVKFSLALLFPARSGRTYGLLKSRRTFFNIVPKPYTLISWPLQKVLFLRYPLLHEIRFPFFSDPVLALSFVSSRI